MVSSVAFHSNSVNLHNSSGVLPLPVVLGLVIIPSIAGIVVLRTTLRHLESLGVISEEVFRGDRLPVLPFPDKS